MKGLIPSSYEFQLKGLFSNSENIPDLLPLKPESFFSSIVEPNSVLDTTRSSPASSCGVVKPQLPLPSQDTIINFSNFISGTEKSFPDLKMENWSTSDLPWMIGSDLEDNPTAMNTPLPSFPLPISSNSSIPQTLMFPPWETQYGYENMKPFLDQELLLQQIAIEDLCEAAEMLEKGNMVLAHGILARLNHYLPARAGSPFLRAAFYTMEALQLLVLRPNIDEFLFPASHLHNPQFDLIHKISAYKLFSEISPIPQFVNFTCIQATIEAIEKSDRIHIVDFDIGYGGRWASLIQELALRKPNPFSLKITALVSSIIHDQLELALTRQNLNHFASEINMAAFEFQVLNFETINSEHGINLLLSKDEAIAVNIPVGSSSCYSFPLLQALKFAKQLSPKIIVSMDGGYDRSDLSFPQLIHRVLVSNQTLLDTLDAANINNADEVSKIEKFLLYPDIEKIVAGHYRFFCFREKAAPWRDMFMSAGFSPLVFSNFSESQAECVIRRNSVRGFHVEKKHSSLVLCWKQKEIVSISTWR